jgi:hypothetical protein
MIRTVFAALAMIAASAPAAAQDDPFGRDPADPVSSFALKDKAGNRQYHMVVPAAGQPGERCMSGTRLCFSVVRGESGAARIHIRDAGQPGGTEALPLDLAADGEADLSIWPLAVRRVPFEEADAAGEAMFVGVLAQERIGYSGGGAHRTMLWLYRVDNAGTGQATARQIVSLPFDAGQTIRACFNKQDEDRRRDACLDETNLATTLLLDEANADSMPKLIYRTIFSSYPGDIPLREPEQQPARLSQSDKVWAYHPHCSYERRLAWNPATARYEFDRPAPDCRLFGLER